MLGMADIQSRRILLYFPWFVWRFVVWSILLQNTGLTVDISDATLSTFSRVEHNRDLRRWYKLKVKYTLNIPQCTLLRGEPESFGYQLRYFSGIRPFILLI